MQAVFDAKKIRVDIVRWIRDFFAENGPSHIAVIGLSGGKDSTVSASLCCEALGAERVFGVMMPQGEQWDIDMAFKAADWLGIKSCLINIKEVTDALYKGIIGAGLKLNDQAMQNAPARIRMSVLYAVAAIHSGRVVNNCNLSEDYVGYSTKFGDAAGDFSPLSRLTATEVRALGREMGLPSVLVDKPPEDGLCAKTDEDNFGFSYAVLDRYIREGICEDLGVKNRIDKMHAANLHKLRPIPCYEYLNG